MTCVDCEAPSSGDRCADCLEEVHETPNWQMEQQNKPPTGALDAGGRTAERRCCGCGAILTSPPGLGRPRIYCGRECYPSVALSPAYVTRRKARSRELAARIVEAHRMAREHAEPRHCQACNAVLEPGRRRFCSAACSQWAARHPGERRIGRTCRRCGVAIASPKRDWCSKLCFDIARGYRLDPALPRVPPVNSLLCTEPGCTNSRKYTNGLCSSHANRRREAALGLDWRSRTGDPDRVRQKNRMKTRRRRAEITDPQAQSIYINMVGERDGWRCGVPGCRRRRIDPTKSWPHPLSPSIDHIEPLSRGGLHVYANVRIAHLRCNVARGNRFDHEQLALFG